MEETTSVEGRERRVVYYYDDVASCTNYICSCKCFREALRALLKCLGLDSETSPTDVMCSTTTTTTTLIMSTSDHDHKDQEDQAAAGNNVDVIVYDGKPVACQDPVASGSSSSSSSSSGSKEQTMAEPPSTVDLPTSSHPSPSTDDPTSDPAVLALGSRRAPPRSPVTSGCGGQTN